MDSKYEGSLNDEIQQVADQLGVFTKTALYEAYINACPSRQKSKARKRKFNACFQKLEERRRIQPHQLPGHFRFVN